MYGLLIYKTICNIIFCCQILFKLFHGTKFLSQTHFWVWASLHAYWFLKFNLIQSANIQNFMCSLKVWLFYSDHILKHIKYAWFPVQKAIVFQMNRPVVPTTLIYSWASKFNTPIKVLCGSINIPYMKCLLNDILKANINGGGGVGKTISCSCMKLNISFYIYAHTSSWLGGFFVHNFLVEIWRQIEIACDLLLKLLVEEVDIWCSCHSCYQ